MSLNTPAPLSENPPDEKLTTKIHNLNDSEDRLSDARSSPLLLEGFKSNVSEKVKKNLRKKRIRKRNELERRNLGTHGATTHITCLITENLNGNVFNKV